jgi:hypothetical protein
MINHLNFQLKIGNLIYSCSNPLLCYLFPIVLAIELDYPFSPAMWSPSVSVVESPSTSAGDPTPSSLPAAYWGGVFMLQLQTYWALRSRVSPALSVLLS